MTGVSGAAAVAGDIPCVCQQQEALSQHLARQRRSFLGQCSVLNKLFAFGFNSAKEKDRVKAMKRQKSGGWLWCNQSPRGLQRITWDDAQGAVWLMLFHVQDCRQS